MSKKKSNKKVKILFINFFYQNGILDNNIKINEEKEKKNETFLSKIFK